MLLEILKVLSNNQEDTSGSALDLIGSLGYELLENAIITSAVKSIMDALFGFLQSILEFIRTLFFGYSGPVGPFALIHLIIGTVSATILVIIILKKGVQNKMNMAGSGDYVNPSKLIMDVIKSSGLAVFLPWLVSFSTAVLPAFAELIFSTTLIPTNTIAWTSLLNEEQRAYIDSGWDNWLLEQLNPGWCGFYFFISLMICVGSVCFLISQCKWHVEMMIIDACSILAALDSVTDKKEFYETWLSSFKAICIVQVANIALFGLMINRFIKLCTTSSYIFSMDAILAIGAACCLIKGTVLTNKFKNGGMMGGGMSAVTNAARTGVFMLPK